MYLEYVLPALKDPIDAVWVVLPDIVFAILLYPTSFESYLQVAASFVVAVIVALDAEVLAVAVDTVGGVPSTVKTPLIVVLETLFNPTVSLQLILQLCAPAERSTLGVK